MMLAFYGIALAAFARVIVWYVAARWWHILVIAVGWMPIFPLVVRWLTGDVSRYLPQSMFSEGAQGKDEIVVASAYSMIMIAIITASLVFWAIRSCWGLMRRVLIRLGH